MAPTKYSDLGKEALGVLSDGFNYGLCKLKIKTKASSGVAFSSGVTATCETSAVDGNIEATIPLPDYSVTMKEKWSSDNKIVGDISAKNIGMDGIGFGLRYVYEPKSYSISGKVRTNYVQDMLNVRLEVDIDPKPVIAASAVATYSDVIVGLQTGFDTDSGSCTKNNVCLGFSTGDMIIHSNCNDGHDFCGTIFNKCTPELDSAVKMKWCTQTGEGLLQVGFAKTLEGDAVFRGKIGTDQHIAIGYQQKIRPGICVTASARFDGTNFNTSGHKFGIGVTLEP